MSKIESKHQLMSYVSEIEKQFQDSISAKEKTIHLIKDQIDRAAQALIYALKKNQKILICGNGGSAADAQHFAAELVGRFETERQALAAIALTTDTSILTAVSNDYQFENIFSRQIAALGQKDDILFAISTSGNSGNIIKAVQQAKDKDMITILLTGNTGGQLSKEINNNNIILCVPEQRTARIQEVHLLIIHSLCMCIDQAFN